MTKRDNSMTGAAGVFYVCFELCRRGYIPMPTIRDSAGVDILMSSADGSKVVDIQVKTTTKRKWWLNKKAETLVADSLFYAFVELPDDGSVPRCHIVPSAAVADYVRKGYADWLAAPGKHGQPHNANPGRDFRDEGDAYLDRWDLLEAVKRAGGIEP